MRADDQPPPLRLFLREGFAIASRFYRALGRLGEFGPESGHPVMVLPGFLASDHTTLGLQRALGAEGYRVTGWGMGLNKGARPDTIDRLVERVESFCGERPVTLVGWSLGGLYAREVAKARPELVNKVVTLGSPFAGDPRANNVWRLYEMIAGHPVDNPPLDLDLQSKPPVPTLAIWSRRDGIVAPACARGCDGQSDRQVEIDCSHMGFAVSKRAYPKIIAALRDF
ncbi:MAG TPA: alpha/beta hydrolase [Allosphingosinicella sp.]|uniref:alpha/beta fold hydrolase n=1 Tax=Allosphingosinicella sp. TaxID=2823234 RepID=UPI002EDB0F2C